MPDRKYRIRMRRGHSRRLRFWFAPVSDKIMNADADWIEDAELSCDALCTKELFLPFIEKYLPGKFEWHSELNLMPFENVREMTAEVRKVCKLLKSNYNDPALAPYKKNYAIDLLVDADEYNQKYADAGSAEKAAAVEEHVDVVIEFYTRLANWLDDTCDKYEPLGFNAIAIFSPR